MPTSRAERIARVVHEANRAYCQTLKDYTQPGWDHAPTWQRESVVAGVVGILDDTITTPEQSHASWTAKKLSEGWQHGPLKNTVAKTHPCLVAYADLPPEQQMKDRLFFAIVRALAVA